MSAAFPSTESPQTPSAIAAAVRDAQWLAHRYDPGADAIHLIRLPRADHRRATFLTDEYLPSGLQPLVVSRGGAIATAPLVAPLHFIFHSAFCCSTLLARAMDVPSRAMGLKEPVILNDIVGWRRRGGTGPDMASVLDDALKLLSRPFEPGEAVVVKPSTVTNGLASAMLTLRPAACAVLLYAPLRTYLGSIARKGLDGRLWVRTLLAGMLDDKSIDFGFTARDYLGLTDLQVAAIGWLAHQRMFADLANRYGTRVRTLDSATLMDDPATVMAALSALFGLALQPPEIDAILTGPAFTTHSKNAGTFGPEERAAELNQRAAIHADEIDKVAQWTDVVAAGAGVSLTPGPPVGDLASPAVRAFTA